MARPRTLSDEQILEAARDCLLGGGSSVSTAAIASKLGVSEAALFKRFGTKERLVIQALRPPQMTWLARIDQGPRPDEPLPSQLEALAKEISAWFELLVPRMAVLRALNVPLELAVAAGAEGTPQRSGGPNGTARRDVPSHATGQGAAHGTGSATRTAKTRVSGAGMGHAPRHMHRDTNHAGENFSDDDGEDGPPQPPPLRARRALERWFARAMRQGRMRKIPTRPLAEAFLGALEHRSFHRHLAGTLPDEVPADPRHMQSYAQVQAFQQAAHARYLRSLVDLFWRGLEQDDRDRRDDPDHDEEGAETEP